MWHRAKKKNESDTLEMKRKFNYVPFKIVFFLYVGKKGKRSCACKN